MPSLYEAVSLSGLESLSCSVPVIGTRVGGIPEFVLHEDTGLLVEPRSPEALADILITILAHPELRAYMSRRGRALAFEYYSCDPVARRTLDFYTHLAETKREGLQP
ncbi:MAG: glycosyltransferase [Terriglobia bacterium]